MNKYIILLLGIIAFGVTFMSCNDDNEGTAVNVTITNAKLLTGDIFAIDIQESKPTQLESFIMPKSAREASVIYKFQGTPTGAFEMTEGGMITPLVKTPAQGEILLPLGSDTIIATVNDGSGTFVKYPVRIISDTILVSSITVQSAGQVMELMGGRTFDLAKQLTINPANATRKGVVYSTDDPTVATVDQNGLVTATSDEEGRSTKIHITATDRGKATTTATVMISIPPKYLAHPNTGVTLSSNLGNAEKTTPANLLDDNNSTFWIPLILKRPIYSPVCYLDIDMGAVVNFGQFGYRHRNHSSPHLHCHTFKLQAKVNESDAWMDLRECVTTLVLPEYQTFELDAPIDVRYIRVTFIKGHLKAGKTDWDYEDSGSVSVGDILVYKYNW